MKNQVPTVLIVDDEPDLREIIEFDFDLAGYNILMAENGLAALEVLKTNEVDAVVSDIVMPKMDGVQFLQELRKKGSQPIVVFVTAHSAYKENIIFSLGGNGLVRKPFKRKSLVQNCERLLLDPKKRWSTPRPGPASFEIKIQWQDLEEAWTKDRFKMGLGGFCLKNILSSTVEEETQVHFEFKIGPDVLVGEAALRWNNAQILSGFEFLYVDEKSFQFWNNYIQKNSTLAFIPNPI